MRLICTYLPWHVDYLQRARFLHDIDDMLHRSVCYAIYHGFVGVSSSLELNSPEGISGAELRVFAD